jgi:hypothetical protein
MAKRLSFETIQSTLVSNDLKILGNHEYKNHYEPLPCIDKDGFKYMVNVYRLSKGQMSSTYGNGNRFTFDNIKLYVSSFAENADYITLISDRFIKSNEKLIFNCAKHGLFEMKWNKFQQGQRCYACSKARVADSIRGIPLSEELRKKLSIAHIGIQAKEKHPQWNPNLTDEDRLRRRDIHENKKFVKSVLERDKYTCKHCLKHGGKLNVHHLDAWGWCIEKRFDINNGITLCVSCHRGFHRVYGYKNITKNKFIEWMRSSLGAIFIAQKELSSCQKKKTLEA